MEEQGETLCGPVEGPAVLFQQQDMFQHAFPVMEEIRRQGKLCDVTVRVDEASFSAHRIVLCATIPYFQAMFTSDMLESRQREVTIKGIDSAAMEQLIQFAYSGRIAIQPHNAHSLMIGASYLQMTQVRDACAAFFEKRLEPANVVSVRQFAENLSCLRLVEAADQFLERHFSQVALDDEFVGLQAERVEELLGRDRLCVASEEQVFEALMRWVRKEPQLRTPYLPDLLAKVRLPLLSPVYLTDAVATEELIRSSHRCRDLVDEAKDFHLLPERRPLMQSFRCRPRCSGDDAVGLLYAVGGLTKAGDSLSTVEVMDPVTGKWSPAEAMSMLRSRVGVAVLRDKLYAIGGYNGSERLNTVEVLDGARRQWSRAAPMTCKRSAVGAAALGQRLFVCGGYDGVTSLNTVESYDPDGDVWTPAPAMNKHRSAAGVAAFDGHVYGLGGHDGLSIFDSVERFDPTTGVWLHAAAMLSKRCRLGVAVLGGALYACGGYDGSTFLRSVEAYDARAGRWTPVAAMNVARSRVALAANGDRLYAVGGYDGVANLSSVEVFDPRNGVWNFASSMCAHEGGVGLGVIPIH